MQIEQAAPASEPAEKKDIFSLISESVTKNESEAASADAELLFVGSKGSGKSTLVQAFLQKDELPKPSTPLEFKFARRAAGNSTAVANVWELGGGVSGSSAELLKVVMLPERLPRCVVAIVLDMSEPESALGHLVSWMTELRKRVDDMRAELALSPAGNAIATAARKATESKWSEHPDAEMAASEPVKPLGVSVVFVCHKWDQFMEVYTEAEQRKVLCRTLRFLAHQAGASLICTKHKDKGSLQMLRNMLYHCVFEAPIDGRLLQQDHGRALFIPATADAFASIGKAPTVQGCLSDEMGDKWRAVYDAMFPPKEAKREQQDLSMVEAEQFAEEAIDELRRQKKDELSKARAAAEFEARMSQEVGSINNKEN